MKNLKEAKIGETVRVVKIHGEGAIKRRIMDMGLTKGVEVYIRKVAPLGDPMEVTVRAFSAQGRCRTDRGRISRTPREAASRIFNDTWLASANQNHQKERP